MVILETAAIGAAGYGLYKGGEASVKKGKECHREIQREKKRSSQQSTLREKTNSRGSRIAEIVQMKKNVTTSNTPRFGFRSNGANTNTSTRGASFTERQLAEKEASSEINDRHRNVMEKLKSSRREVHKKSGKGLSSLNPFKKK